VFAHPDDETFCVGGTLAKYADAGVGIDLFCATHGDAGKSAGVPVSSREELASIRKTELDRAAAILGIERVVVCEYGDGTLATLEPTELIGDIVRFIRVHRPGVVLTFGPEGAPTAHRDHRALSRATMAAFFLSGLATAYADQDVAPYRAQRLFFHSWKHPLADPRLVTEPVPATAFIDVREWKQRKVDAFHAHATQRLSEKAFQTSLVDVERLAFAAGVPQPRAEIEDLFEGL